MIRIPANSTRKIQSRVFKPLFLGEFRISCLGLKKTVLIREPLKIGQGIGPLVVDWLDPEYALSRGIKGYVNISYVSEMPPRIIVSPGKVIHYTIQLQLIPYVPEFTEAEVLLDPENASNFRVDYVLLKDYIRYSPNGTILLRVDEPRNVTMVLSVPDGSTGMSVHPRYMLGIGIFADVPVASAGSVGLNRIPRARALCLKQLTKFFQMTNLWRRELSEIQIEESICMGYQSLKLVRLFITLEIDMWWVGILTSFTLVLSIMCLVFIFIFINRLLRVE